MRPETQINALPLMHGGNERECLSVFKTLQGLFICDVSSNETCLSCTLIVLFIWKPHSLWVKSGRSALAVDYCHFRNSHTPMFSSQMARPQIESDNSSFSIDSVPAPLTTPVVAHIGYTVSFIRLVLA